MEESEELVGELTRLVCPVDDEKRGGGLDRKAVVAGLTCLVAITTSRRARAEMVRLGAMPVAVHILEANAGSPSQALRVLEAAVGCAEGATVCESARMGGAEAAVSPTLPIRARQHECHGLYAPIPHSNLRCIQSLSPIPHDHSSLGS